MERAVQVFALINFVIVGVSHAARPRAWSDFFALLRERGETGIIAGAFPNLVFGSVVVAFHNVWSGIPLVLTVFGWASVAKALVYFAFPALPLRKLGPTYRVPEGSFVGAGVFFLLLAAALGYHLWATR